MVAIVNDYDINNFFVQVIYTQMLFIVITKRKSIQWQLHIANKINCYSMGLGISEPFLNNKY